jgi:hypothetical protein
MDLRARWRQFDALCGVAEHYDDIEVWAYGSAIRQDAPRDLDVLLLYDDRPSVVAIRSARKWAETSPPCHIIAMTRAEEREYGFIQLTGATRFV